MKGVTFELIEYLFALIFIPFGVFFRHVWKRRGSTVHFSFSIHKNDVFKRKINPARLLYVLASCLYWFGFASIILALAGPVRISKDRVFLNRGIDIMFVVDLSPSMAARDFEPLNRFESAKQVIKNFVSTRENDPIGIVTFGTEAALRVPPTLDYDLLVDRINAFQIMEQGKDTAIGMGIITAALHLKESTAINKVIVLLTDGVNNAGDIMPESAADIASKMGIRIYVVGIGSEQDVIVEYEDLDSGEVFQATTTRSYDEILLGSIADISGGKFYTASSTITLESVFNAIDSAESYEKKVKVNTFKEPLYKIFLFYALICILADFFIRKVLLQEVLP